MKTTTSLSRIFLPLLRSAKPIIMAAGLLLCSWRAPATTYSGNGNSSFGGAIGNGTLTLMDDGNSIFGTLTVPANMNDVLVVYIQTGPGGDVTQRCARTPK